MAKKKIGLGNYRSPGAKIFSGRPTGENARAKIGLDKLDKDNTVQVVFFIPPDTWTISSSYFSGLFCKSVVYLGEDEFRTKYTFDTNSPQIQMDYDDGIKEILKELA